MAAISQSTRGLTSRLSATAVRVSTDDAGDTTVNDLGGAEDMLSPMEATDSDAMGSDELPLPDYDELSLAVLRHRIRTLDEAALCTVLNHECGHAARTRVLELLDGRLRELEHGAKRSGGAPADTPASGNGVRRRAPLAGHSKAFEIP
jgi:hypothetical protein